MEKEKAKRRLENVVEEVTYLRQTRSKSNKLTKGTSKVGENGKKNTK